MCIYAVVYYFVNVDIDQSFKENWNLNWNWFSKFIWKNKRNFLSLPFLSSLLAQLHFFFSPSRPARFLLFPSPASFLGRPSSGETAAAAPAQQRAANDARATAAASPAPPASTFSHLRASRARSRSRRNRRSTPTSWERFPPHAPTATNES